MSFRRLAFLALIFVGCGDDAGLPDARPLIDAPPAGKLQLTWTLSHGGAPQTCSSIGASSIVAGIVPVNQPFGVTDVFGCSLGTGTSRDLAPGRYIVTVAVAGVGDLDEPVVFRDVEVTSSSVTPVGPAAFDVEPTGSLVFRMATTATGGNCAATSAMGAGITATTIVLRDAANACVPTTFTIAAGANDPGGTYVSDCNGSSYGCIAADQDLRADGVTAGQHSMLFTGAVGAVPCWKRTSQFTTRAANQVTVLNPQTLMLDTAACPAM